MLAATNADGKIVILAASGKMELTPEQVKHLDSMGIVAICEIDEHAKIQVFNEAQRRCIIPVAMGVDRPICPKCQREMAQAIRRAGNDIADNPATILPGACGAVWR